MLWGAPFVWRENMGTTASDESWAFKLKNPTQNRDTKRKGARTFCPSPFSEDLSNIGAM
jgi:hypothetical protein